jgi:hypothetical protein
MPHMDTMQTMGDEYFNRFAYYIISEIAKLELCIFVKIDDHTRVVGHYDANGSKIE